MPTTEDRLLDLERRLEKQEAALARVLPYFPERAAPLERERLHQILEDLVDYTQTVFPDRAVTGIAVPDNDRESSTAHRLELRVANAEEIDPPDFVERAFNVYGHASDHLTPEEFQAISLAVEPRYA